MRLSILLFIIHVRSTEESSWPSKTSPPSGSPPGLHRLPFLQPSIWLDGRIPPGPDVGPWSSLALGCQGTLPRVQTLKLARAPLPARADGVWEPLGSVWVSGTETHGRDKARGRGQEGFHQKAFTSSFLLLYLSFTPCKKTANLFCVRAAPACPQQHPLRRGWDLFFC